MPALLLFVMLTACAACPQDLSGKMFTFPQETNTARVMLNISAHTLKAVTVCLRSFTDLNRMHTLFSLATPSYANGLLIFRQTGKFDLFVNDQLASYVLDYELNTWHSICSTWDSGSGLGQLWFNGKALVRKFTSKSQINKPLVVLGQEQDSYGGKFEIKQSFVGMMTDVHMWNYVLSSCEIQNYVGNMTFTPGNVVNWEALTFVTTGHVLIENKQLTCLQSHLVGKGLVKG